MAKQQRKISVALCTYHGGKYLLQQLESIANQRYPPDELVVCDDNSTDQTLDILGKFAASSSFPVEIYHNKPGLGVLMNFSKAVSLCKGDYIALSDQDDVWLPNKLELLLQGMLGAEDEYGQQTPLLIHTDLQVVDSACRPLAPSFMKMVKVHHPNNEPLKTLLVQNFVTGCTAMMNRSLINYSLPIPEEVMMHDWWFALVAACCGRIVFLPEVTVLYRQHSSNVVGAKEIFSYFNFRRLLGIRSLEQDIAHVIKQGAALQKHLERQLGCTKKTFLDNYLLAVHKGGMVALCATITHGVAKQGFFRNLIYYYLLTRGGYTRYLCEDAGN